MERSSQKPKPSLPPQPHFVFVTYPGHGHINPVVHLASRLTRSTASRATFAISVSAYRRMFPSAPPTTSPSTTSSPTPISDGYDDGIKDQSQFSRLMSELRRIGSQNLSDLLLALAAPPPASSTLSSSLGPPTSRVGTASPPPSSGSSPPPSSPRNITSSRLRRRRHRPRARTGLRGELPAPPTLSEDFSSFFTTLRELFANLDAAPAKVLVNTFDGLEPDGVASVSEYMEVVTVGPAVPAWSLEAEVVGGKVAGYMRWLDERPARSVLYVSFGSYLKTNRPLMTLSLSFLASRCRARSPIP